MRFTKTDPLLPAIESFESALRAVPPHRGKAWLDKVQHSLNSMERAIMEHALLAEAKDGLMGAMNDRTHSVRPTLERRLERLHEDHERLLDQVLELRAHVQEREEIQRSGWRRALRMFRPYPTADQDMIRREGERLVEQLRDHKESENKLLLDTINTDIGTGD
jgi:hypothetical protein